MWSCLKNKRTPCEMATGLKWGSGWSFLFFFSACRTAQYFIVDFISVPCLNHPIVIQLVMLSAAAACCSSCDCLCMCVRLLDKMHATCFSTHPLHTKLPGSGAREVAIWMAWTEKGTKHSCVFVHKWMCALCVRFNEWPKCEATQR